MDNIPFARPCFGKEEEEAAVRAIRSGWITTGPETLAFETEFAAFLEHPEAFLGSAGPDPAASVPAASVPSASVPSASMPAASSARNAPLTCLAVNSATSGLHLALEALGIGPGDAVAVPSYTFTATAEVVRYLGAEVVFIDTAPDSFHMDPRALEETLDRLDRGLPAYPPRGKTAGRGFGPRGRPGAVIPVHYGGLPCDMEAILAVSRKYGAGVVEDAAHSFPSFVPGKKGSAGSSAFREGGFAGVLGDIGVFSFYATKTITTGEGGMAVSRNRNLAKRMAAMRSHGIDRAIWNRYTDKKASWYYEVTAPGFKYNMPDILAAIGRVQLRRAPELLRMRRNIARRYDGAFGGDRRFLLPPTGAGDARHLYPLRLNTGVLSLSRDRFIEKLQEAGIGVSVHFIPLHIMPYYQKWYKLEREDFPESCRNFEREVSLPIWPGMKEEQVQRVIGAVQKAASA
ncbi:MAG: DegT/DnrJ/EryC1/StrS aminotransferase family protein [Treponema sp.]|jgi:dTDP-4-amino-4,6-dideoxygalactose transaminase|nr:DegT/DnrJ/EryC1/StrS aminotransferase family protein [Treponema sp.]